MQYFAVGSRVGYTRLSLAGNAGRCWKNSMDESSRSAGPIVFPSEDRLNSWKEIASHFNRDVTTVQRWEKREGMPVHRHLHDKMGSVYASRKELESWARARNLPPSRETTSIGPTISHPPEFLETPPAAPKSNVGAAWHTVPTVAALACVGALAAWLWISKTEYLWRNPIAGARFQLLTDFDGTEQAATVSRDGNLVAFQSDRDGRMDLWLTLTGSGDFRKLTQAGDGDVVNNQIRTLGFLPDGSAVTFWQRKQPVTGGRGIGIWAAPTLGGLPRPYLEGVAEFDWSHDGSRLVFHRPDAGDSMFVTDSPANPGGRPIFTAPEGVHCHFPLWSPDGKFIYFVRGALPDKLDVWRIRAEGGTPERITSHDSRVSHPVLLDNRTLLYLASDADGSGPWLYGMDVERRIPHRLTSGLDRFTSLAASADGRRLVVTRATPKSSLWSMRLNDSRASADSVARIPLTTRSAFSPRWGPNYLAYVSNAGAGDGIWTLADGMTRQIWSGVGARIIGGPAIARDGRRVAFSVRQGGRTPLYTMNSDGTDSRIVTDSLELNGSPAWTPDGQSLTVAGNDHGIPHLYRVAMTGGRPAPFLREYSLDAVWSPDGGIVAYSGPDIGTMFSVKAATAAGVAHALPPLTLTRGARHLVFVDEGRKLVFLRGEMQHQNLWLVDLATNAEQQLTYLDAEFNVRDFDVSPDGREIVLERVQERSDVVLLDRAGKR